MNVWQLIVHASRPRDLVSRDVLARDPLIVAPDLLGAVLARVEQGQIVRSGRIVEVEAYRGEADPASHAFRGPTPRTRVMFGQAGHLYVYRSYGIHWCANVVCDATGVAGAVLIRAIEPRTGIDAMFVDRPKAKRAEDLASGPGKLCAALGITGANGGTDLCAESDSGFVLIESVSPCGVVKRGPRIGISAARELPWRFWISGNPHVSARG